MKTIARENGFNIFSLLWTLLVHTLVVALLLVIHLTRPIMQAESGVPVMLGNMGNLDTDYEFTEVNSMPAPAPAAVPVPVAPQAEPAITQNLEETVAIESGEKEKPVKPADTPKQPTPEEIIRLCLYHAELEVEHKGEYTAMREMRPHIMSYLKGQKDAARKKRQLMQVTTLQELQELLSD